MDEDAEWGLVTPFWIDTEAYSDRDRLMFVCGVEFQMVYDELKTGDPVDRTFHLENESRLRMLCARMKRSATITSNVAEGWSRLEVE